MKPRIPSASRRAPERVLVAFSQLFVFALLACLAHSPARAGLITLKVSATATVHGQQLDTNVSVTNQGDESAANVQVHVDFQGRRQSSPSLPSLGVQKNHTAAFSMPAAGLAPGRHSLAIIVDYTDTNGYPFTALSFADFIFGEDSPPRIHATMKAVELGREADLDLRLKNLDATPRELKLRLILPKEISAAQTENRIALGGSSEQTVRFQLRNFSALEASTYQIFVLIEYDEKGKHSSRFTPGTVKIVAAKDNIFASYRAPLLAGVGLLVILFVGLQIYSRLRKRPQG